MTSSQTRVDDLCLNVTVSEGVAHHDDDQATIDQALRLVAGAQAALSADLGLPTALPSIAALRRSPLGRKLQRLAAVARGASDVTHAGVREDAESVIALVLRPIGASEDQVPEWFWQTALGRILAGAIACTYRADNLLCLESVAERLDENRATIERWIETGMLEAVRDETGQRFIPAEQIERFRMVARLFDGDPEFGVDDLVEFRAA